MIPCRGHALHSLDPISGILTCESGCILESLEHYASDKGFQIPVDLGARGRYDHQPLISFVFDWCCYRGVCLRGRDFSKCLLCNPIELQRRDVRVNFTIHRLFL